MAEDSGFFSRWSKRKVQARNEALTQDAPETTATPVSNAASKGPAAGLGAPVASASSHESPPSADKLESPSESKPPPPTLDDVATLTPESDFARFVKSDVSGEVRNAALKKLFADPHFNVMDGLDTYIEDFNQTTPLPLSTIRQMAQSAFLGLAEPQPEPAQEARRTIAQGDEEASVASPRHAEPEPAPEPEEVEPHDENSDLRLQSLDTPGSPSPQPGT